MSSPGFAEDTSTVDREAVVAIHPRRAQTVAADPSPAPATLAPPSRSDHAFVGVLAALTALLAARLLLLLSIAGAFVLALMAMRTESFPGLAILAAFCCLTVIPCVYLDVVTHKRGGQ